MIILLYPNRFAVDERIGDFLVGRGQNAGESALRSVHFFGRFGLLKAFEIFQADSFRFLQ